jgi:hypothetical protein
MTCALGHKNDLRSSLFDGRYLILMFQQIIKVDNVNERDSSQRLKKMKRKKRV